MDDGHLDFNLYANEIIRGLLGSMNMMDFYVKMSVNIDQF